MPWEGGGSEEFWEGGGSEELVKMDCVAEKGQENGSGKGSASATGGAEGAVNTDSVRKKLSVQRTGSVSV
jgi:hypothetical protein